MKLLIPNYTFDASAKTVTFTDIAPVVLKSVLLITNVTDNVIIYNFAVPGKGGAVATNMLTLDFDTTAMDDADDLQIFYEDGTSPATNTSLTDIKTKLDTLIAATDTLESNTDGVEGLLTSIRDYVDTAETKLQAIADNTDGLEGFTDGIETLLTAIRDYVDTLETKLADVSTATNQTAQTALLTTIGTYLDTVETKLQSLIDSVGEVSATPTSNTLQDRLKGIRTVLDTISTNTDSLEGFVDGIETLLTAIRDYVDTLEIKLADVSTATNQTSEIAQLTAIAASVDTVETKLQSIIDNTDSLEGFTDGLEGLLTTIRDNADTLEAKVQAITDQIGETQATPTTNTIQDRLKGLQTTLTAINANTDQLEGFVDGLEALETAIGNNTDTVETKLQSIIDNTDGLEGYVDGLETLATAIGNNTDTVETKLQAIADNTDGLEGYVDGLETLATAIGNNTDTLEAAVGATNETAATTDTATSGINGFFKRLLQRFTTLFTLLPASLGQKTMTGSFPVVLPSDQSLTLAGTVVTGPAYQTASGSITTPTGAVTATVQAFTNVMVQISGTYAGATLNFEQSFDGGNTWFTCPMTVLSLTPSQVIGAVTPGSNATAAYQGTVGGATTFRVRASALSSGTIATVITNTTDPLLYNINASIVNTPTVDTELPAAAALADDASNPTAPAVGGFNMVYDPNDSNWDRARGVNATLNQAGADSGIQAVGLTAQFDDTSPTSITENFWGNLRMSANRNVYHTLRDAAGNERGQNITAAFAALVDFSASAANAIAGLFSVKFDQTTPGTTNAVSLAQIGATTIVNGGTPGSQSVGGIVANNGTINSAVNPVLVGGQAVSSENAAGTTAKLGQFVTDLVGKQIVLPYANPENFVQGVISTAMTSTTSTSCVAAPASGLRNYITTILVSNSHATVGTDILIQDGSGGTTLGVIPAASVYGGASVAFPVAIRQPTTATALYFANVTTGSSTKVSAYGYKGV